MHTAELSPEWTRIRGLVTDPGIKVVSFDLFCTLLVSPCDIDGMLKMLAAHEDMCYTELRRLRKEGAGWWDPFDKEPVDCGRFTREDIRRLRGCEMEAERRLLRPRRSVKAIYDAAKACGKKVIVVSDTHFQTGFLDEVLTMNGYIMDAVYGSDDCGCSKLDGALFDHVMEDLWKTIPDLQPEEIIHIGDTLTSDYTHPRERGIMSVLYPNAGQRYCNTLFGREFRPVTLGDVMITGFIANRVFDDPFSGPRCLKNTLGGLAILLFPLVFCICARMTANGTSRCFNDALRMVESDPKACMAQFDEFSGRTVELSSVLRMICSVMRGPQGSDIGHDAIGYCIKRDVISMCQDLYGLIGWGFLHLTFSLDRFCETAESVIRQMPDNPFLLMYMGKIPFRLSDPVMERLSENRESDPDAKGILDEISAEEQ